MQLQALLHTPIALPSQPRTVALVLAELSRAQPSLRRLNEHFGSDPVLAARLLQEANSPAFAAQHQIKGVPEALALLGQAQLHTLASTAHLGTASGTMPGVNLQLFWRYSLNAAKLARSFAGLLLIDPLAAYTAGLLHALGQLTMHRYDAQRMLELDSAMHPLDNRRARFEQHQLGFCYAHVSAGLAAQWQLPQELVDALNHHPRPLDNDVYEPLAAVLHLAAWRARTREAGLNQRQLAVSFPSEVGLALGLDMDMVLQQDPIDWNPRSDDDAFDGALV